MLENVLQKIWNVLEKETPRSQPALLIFRVVPNPLAFFFLVHDRALLMMREINNVALEQKEADGNDHKDYDAAPTRDLVGDQHDRGRRFDNPAVGHHDEPVKILQHSQRQ